jgi:predicted HicB family RNase H-like nuclease
MTITNEYKGYVGTVDVDMERGVCRGKILFIRDLVTYEAANPKELQQEFHAAVDDYLDTCAELGREAQKPMSGVFNVRVAPDLHKAASTLAARQGCSLNAVVSEAISLYVETNCPAKLRKIQIEHTHTHQVTIETKQDVQHRIVSANTKPQWESVNGNSLH